MAGVNLTATIAGIEIATPIWNAAGALCTTLDELEAVGSSASGVIETKSCTLLPREGNPKPRYVPLKLGSINSMGLPNHGYQKYVEYGKELKKYNKPLIASVSGLSLSDNIIIIKAMNDSVYDLIELNLSCPNIVGKPQVGYDPEQTELVLKEVFKVTKKPLGVKLPPYFDFVHFEEIAAILKKYPLAFISCINSVGNGLVIDVDKEEAVIKPKAGFGGIGGSYIKPTALANVRKFYELLHDKIQIIGVGGITSGKDIFEFILAGASAVQVGTTLMEEGTSCFARLEKELKEVMEIKRYNTLNDFRGKLKEPAFRETY